MNETQINESQIKNKKYYFNKKIALEPVRVKGEMNLRNGMWHGLRNDIIMRNVIYRKWPKEIN